MRRTLPLLLLSAFLLTGCQRSIRVSVDWPPPPVSNPCPVRLLPESALTAEAAEARIVDAEKRVIECELERRLLLRAWPTPSPKPEPAPRQR
jgi:hypothetical protein